MASTTEYSLSELGPWKAVGGDPSSATVWESPDPHHSGNSVYYSQRSGGMYVDGNQRPIYFEGTEPRQRGFPRPEDAAALGTPFQQWESGLTTEEWAAWIGLE